MMTPSEKNIVKSLIAVAWADGTVKEPERGMIDSLLWAFGASDDEEAELQQYAKKKRKLSDDIPISELGQADRELLLAHAALLTHADGKQTKAEERLLSKLVQVLAFSDHQAEPIIANAKQRAAKLAERL